MKLRGIFAASFALVTLLAMLTIGFAYNELEAGSTARAWVGHTHDVIEQNQQVRILLQTAESSQRAFLISGDARDLGPYQASLASLPAAQANLQRLVADNADELARVRDLNHAIGARLGQLGRSIELARRGQLAQARSASEANVPGAGGAHIFQASESIAAAERGLLVERRERVAGTTKLTVTTGVGLSAVALLALLALIFYLARANERLAASLEDTARANAERDAAEQRLREAQRMEAIGQITGGVAHDFNNLLQVIRGNLEMLEPALADNVSAKRRLDNAIHGADRAAQLTRQLLAFASRQPLSVQVMNLSELVADMTDILRRTLGERVEVKTLIAPDLWNALADPAQMESAILNLAINARDAMAEGGSLVIEAANARLEQSDLDAAGGATPGEYVLVRVTDTGEGMTADARARAFEPFFTTKGEGRGSGLGLSMVYGFVRQSSGHIRLESTLKMGTSVSLYLPRSAAEARAAPPPARLAPVAGETILVVEDDANVRLTVVSTLEALGYRCLEATDAIDAIAVVKASATIDLIFTDVIMPGPMKTREMTTTIRALRPGLPILFTSGYPKEEIGEGGKLDDDVSLLSKPYSRDEVAAKIAQMLGQPDHA